MKYAEVIVDVVNSEVDKVFDYSIPDDLEVSEGDMVNVPFGNRNIIGFILRVKDNSNYPLDKIKNIACIVLSRIIKPDILNLIHIMKEK